MVGTHIEDAEDGGNDTKDGMSLVWQIGHLQTHTTLSVTRPYNP